MSQKGGEGLLGEKSLPTALFKNSYAGLSCLSKAQTRQPRLELLGRVGRGEGALLPQEGLPPRISAAAAVAKGGGLEYARGRLAGRGPATDTQ